MRYAHKSFIKSTVADSISILLSQARKIFKDKPERSIRYVTLAWDLIKKYKIRQDAGTKFLFCKKCLVPWVEGKTVFLKPNIKKNVNAYECQCGFRRLRKA